MNQHLLTSAVTAAIIAHATECDPEEACGYILAAEGEHAALEVVRATNHAPFPEEAAVPDAKTSLTVLQSGRVVAAYHSHPTGTECPSGTDEAAARNFGFPVVIYSPVTQRFDVVQPGGAFRG